MQLLCHCTLTGSPGCFTSFNLDKLELYSNHASQNNTELYGGGQEVVSCAAAQDLHAACGSDLASPRPSHRADELLLRLQGASKCGTSWVWNIRTTTENVWSYLHDIKDQTCLHNWIYKGSEAHIYTGGRRGSRDCVLRFKFGDCLVKERWSSSREAHRGWGRTLRGGRGAGGVD